MRLLMELAHAAARKCIWHLAGWQSARRCIMDEEYTIML